MKKNVEIMKVTCVVYEVAFDDAGCEVGRCPIAFCKSREQARELVGGNINRYIVGVNESSYCVPDFSEDD